MHKTRLAAAGVALAVGLAAPAHAQLASRPAAEWKATLEAPARVEGLKIEQVVAALEAEGRATWWPTSAPGTGLFEPQLAYAIGRGRVYAVEIDKGFLDEIDRKVDELHIATIETVLGTPTDPKLPTRAVDLALMHDVLHHVEQRQAYLKAVAQYLKPAGRIAVVEFNPKRQPAQGRPRARRVEGAGRRVDGRGRLRAGGRRRVVPGQVVRDLQAAMRRV